MARIPTAQDALTTFKLTLSPEGDLVEAIEALVRKRSLGAPVIDQTGVVVGILTEKDCLRLVAATSYRELQGQRVAEHMSTLKGTLQEDTDLFSMAEIFLAGNFPVLPVLEDGRLKGRIGRWGLLRQVRALDRAVEVERRRHEQRVQRQENPNSIEGMQTLAGTFKRSGQR